ncbi:DNA topoisomerase family protein [Planctobacterium marinum]|uniref:DNA topoisomerase family protein n=1 Tax=Planctobacterium marinum TaxID=1631968 RepID=UPI0030C72C0E
MNHIDHSLFDHSKESIRHAYGDCPQCQSELRIRNGKSGKFLGCSAYPECDYAQPLGKTHGVETLKVMENSDCPQCHSLLAVKKGRFGMFIGCTNFPECHFIQHDEPKTETETVVSCPKCKVGELVKRANKSGKPFYSCNQYPGCKYILNEQPVAKPCPACQWPVLVKKSETQLQCPQKDCQTKVEV